MSTVYLLDPSSTLVTNIVTKTGSKMSIGNQILPSPPNSIGINYALNVQGATCSNNVSAFQIPADTSNNRPAGQPGYIRYNTESYFLEYWSTQTNSWTAIFQPSPVITSISPSYVNEDSSSNYTITGSNFNSSSSVSFIGAVNGINYLPYGATTLLSSTSLQTRNTLAMSDASINTTGFYVKVVNSDTGLFTTSSTPLLSFNTGPIWNTAANTNLGTGYFDQSFTIINTPYTAINASDANTPISYYYTTAPTGASLVLLDAPSGKLKGTNPSYLGSGTSTAFTFFARAEDSVGAYSVLRQFSFTVSLPIATITGGTSIVGYTDASGNGFSPTSQYTNGYTVYIFTAGTATFATTSYFPPYISYLVVGGGGAGGAGDSGGSAGGGGGAGGYRTGYAAITAGTSYTVTVGNGGTGVSGLNGNNGGSSSITGTGISITSAGGGGGGYNKVLGSAGASGGGGGLRNNTAGGAGNTAQGNAGGITIFGDAGATGRGGGGGSALARGSGGYGNNETSTTTPGGTGGSGISNNIRGTGLVVYSGGGGAGGYDRVLGVGGSGGGGSGSGSSGTTVITTYAVVGTAGTANTGGGGGGSTTGSAAGPTAGGAGGSGIVILRHLTNVISSGIPAAFTINGSTSFGTPISGTYITASGYSTGTNTTPGTATVTYVDSNGLNSRAWSSGPYSGGYTIVTFLTTTPVSPYTVGSPLAVPNQVLYYGNTTDFSFNASSPFPAQIEYLIVAGGGTGAKGTGAVTYGGGGGAGQVLAGTTSISTGTTYTVKVGSGGVMDPNGVSGSPFAGGNTVYYNLTKSGIGSSAFGLSATAGEGGNGGNPPATIALGVGQGGASGNGFLGAQGSNNPAGGGGGASDFGRIPSTSWTNSGGYGIASSISGTYTGYGGGGSGGGDVSSTILIGGTTPLGVVIGGNGGTSSSPTVPTAGAANTGSGGGGMRADDVGAGGGGGTGIIIIKFPSFVC